MHHIPKIAYGGLIQTEIVFEYPPRTDEGERYETAERVTKSISGVRQVIVDHTEAVRDLTFSSLSEEQKQDMRDFYLNFAQYGRGFRYYEDQNSPDYAEYELRDFKFTPKKVGIRGENRFAWEIALSLTRVVGKTNGGGYVQQEILNNQTTPIDIEELVLDESSYNTARVFYEIVRKTADDERVVSGEMVFIFSGGAWDIDPGRFSGVDPGVTFSVTPAGQVQYTSDGMPGDAYEGDIILKNFTIRGV